MPIQFFNYPDESDLDGGTSPNGLYPIPTNLPIETWPHETGSLTLSQWQADVNNTGGEYLIAFDIKPDGTVQNKRNFA